MHVFADEQQEAERLYLTLLYKLEYATLQGTADGQSHTYGLLKSSLSSCGRKDFLHDRENDCT